MQVRCPTNSVVSIKSLQVTSEDTFHPGSTISLTRPALDALISSCADLTHICSIPTSSLGLMRESLRSEYDVGLACEQVIPGKCGTFYSYNNELVSSFILGL